MDANFGCVVDLGSKDIKAGYSLNFPNEAEPRVITPNCATVTLANNAPGPSSSLAPRFIHPIEAGVITDWTVLESILRYVLYDQLGWIEGEEGNLLLAEPILTSRDERELLTQLMFETFNVSGYYVSDQAVLSLYSIGKTSGIVVDVGQDKIDVSPVLEGLLQQSAAIRLPYGGRHLSIYLQQLLTPRGIKLPTLDAADALKISCMSVPVPTPLEGTITEAAAGTSANAHPLEGTTTTTTHTLPDGQVITIENEGKQLGEALFNPTILGFDLPSLPHTVQTASMVTTVHGDRDARKALIENILLCGGGSCVSGMSERMLTELQSLAPHTHSHGASGGAPSICPCPAYMPGNTLKHAAWMGGAVLAKGVFGGGTGSGAQAQAHALTKADYDEIGPACVHRRCS